MTNRLQVHDAITNQSNYHSNSRYPPAYPMYNGQGASPPMGVSYGYQTVTISPSTSSPVASQGSSEASETPAQAPMMV